MARSRVFWSYTVDWLLIVVATLVALLLANVPPDSHTFCLLDISLSYPHREQPKVPLWLLIILTVILPVICIVACTLFAQQSPIPANRATESARCESNRIWQLNAGLLGLGVSLATSTIIYTGVKNLSGKPRPDFLSICQPNLDKVDAYTVGGYGREYSRLWVMVDRGICQQPDKMWLNDALRSFPSGYATIAFAGLWYLSLWFCSRFGVTLPASHYTVLRNDREREDHMSLLGDGHNSALNITKPSAPSLLFLFLPYVPLGLAIFIAGTRYFDFRNHGFDVIAGAAVGAVTAWFGFRWYHPSLSSPSCVPWISRSNNSPFAGNCNLPPTNTFHTGPDLE